MDIPNTLCRYYSFDNGLELLKFSKFRLNSIFEWNDPFEFLPKSKFPNAFLFINEKTTDKEIIEIAQKVYDREGLVFTPFDLTTWAVNWIPYKKFIQLLKEYRERMSFFRLGCFSEKTNDLLMWAHYGRQHTGIAINFKTAIDFWGNNLFKVNYTDKRIRPNISIWDIGEDIEIVAWQKWQRELLITKATCWSYENEWRYIIDKQSCQKEGEKYYKMIDTKCIAEIFLGCKMSQNNKNAIREILEKKWPKVSVHELEPDESQYQLNIKY